MNPESESQPPERRAPPPRPPRRLRGVPLIAALLTAGLAILTLIGLLSFTSIQNFAAANAMTERSAGVLAGIVDVASTAIDAETGARGFVVTGQESFLEPYNSAVKAMHSRLGELENFAAESPDRRRQVAHLKSLVDHYLSSLDQMIAARRQPAVETQAALLTTMRQEKSEMDVIRAALAAMTSAENQTQAQRLRQAGHTGRMTTLAISAGGFLALALVGLSAWLIRRELVERRRNEAELLRARAAADRANQAKSDFLAGMSHEIRTPMSAIIGFADLILDPHQTASDRLDHVNTIRRNGDHLLTVINDLLDLSKLESGSFQVDRVECCPCRVLGDVASLMRVRAAEKNLRFEVKNDGPVPATVRSDPARLRQILVHLVGNAVKFTADGSVRLLMKLEEPPGAPPVLRFDIIDTGAGLTPDQIAGLFQPSAPPNDAEKPRFGNAGLGLSLSTRLAELLGGRIHVASAPGRGSTFSLLIDPGPLKNVRRLASCREALAADAPREPAPILELDGRILLIDDGYDNRRLLSVYLRQAGAQVALAENGRIGCDKALAALGSGAPFDVLLMDMQMPELDGYGAASRLRAKGYTGPIIALTARAMSDDRDRCLAAGCTDYLSKPVPRAALLAMVARYLQESRKLGLPAPEKSAPAPFTGTPIKSDLDDESLRSFLNVYISELPSKIAELQTCLDQGDMDELSGKLHNLKGTGGLYGLMPITTAAGKAEGLIHNKAPITAIETQVRELMDIIRRVEGFNPGNAPVPTHPGRQQ